MDLEFAEFLCFFSLAKCSDVFVWNLELCESSILKTLLFRYYHPASFVFLHFGSWTIITNNLTSELSQTCLVSEIVIPILKCSQIAQKHVSCDTLAQLKQEYLTLQNKYVFLNLIVVSFSKIFLTFPVFLTS